MNVMKKIVVFLFALFTFSIAKAQEKAVQIKDLRSNGVYTDIWEWKLDGKELNMIYIDKIMWAYQPTSEHPYTAIVYRIEFFKKEKRGIINYQIVNGNEEDFNEASYSWINDSTANVYLRNTKTGKTGGVVLNQLEMGGGIPIDYVKEK
jgi:hypothetical protein